MLFDDLPKAIRDDVPRNYQPLRYQIKSFFRKNPGRYFKIKFFIEKYKNYCEHTVRLCLSELHRVGYLQRKQKWRCTSFKR